MRLDADDFTLFGLPRRQRLDRGQLDERWRALQAEVHPDRVAAEGAASQRVAMQWALRLNEAHRRLKDPLERAAYLCELAGAPVQASDNTAMPREFLLQQMQWREALEDAADAAAVQLPARHRAPARRAGPRPLMMKPARVHPATPPRQGVQRLGAAGRC